MCCSFPGSITRPCSQACFFAVKKRCVAVGCSDKGVWFLVKNSTKKGLNDLRRKERWCSVTLPCGNIVLSVVVFFHILLSAGGHKKSKTKSKRSTLMAGA